MHPRYIAIFVLILLTLAGLIGVMFGAQQDFSIGYYTRYAAENRAKANQLKQAGQLEQARLAEEDAARDERYAAEARRAWSLGVFGGGAVAALSVLGIVLLLVFKSVGRTTGKGRFDDYLQEQVRPLLRPGEQVLNTAWLFEGTLKHPVTYCAALTTERLLLVQTTMTFFLGRPIPRGVSAIELASVGGCTTGGVGWQREITFILRDGQTLNLRLNTLANVVSGQEAFLQEVPARLSRRGVELASGGR